MMIVRYKSLTNHVIQVIKGKIMINHVIKNGMFVEFNTP